MTADVFKTDLEFAIAMDDRDPLHSFRDRFCFPQGNSNQPSIYLCGHSLGLQPKTVSRYVEQELQDWANLAVEAHFQGRSPWVPYHRLLTEQMAELVGAQPTEVVAMNSLTVNLHLMMASFYRPTPQRHKILVERGAFPSDQYAVKSQIRFHGFDPATSLLELAPSEGESCIRDEDVEGVIHREGHSIALILFGGVNYATGQLFDLGAIAEAARDEGCTVGFDLAHAVGNVPLQLHDWAADFAVWCSYKYLNGGPGCVGGCFVHDRHAREWDLPRFAGWWGHDEKTRFQMGPDFYPMSGAEGWQLSNPPILALAPLRASLEIFAEAGIDRLRTKSISLMGYMEYLLAQKPSSKFSIITPREPMRRGAQLSIRVREGGRKLCNALADAGVVGDWREPDTFRIAAVPLYNSYQDVYQFVERFTGALKGNF